jgi:hypothetical protein
MSSSSLDRVITWKFLDFRISLLVIVCKRLTFLLFITFCSTIRQYCSEWSPTSHIL